ncbi:unnamed protein product [Phaedon cochleariae]|uniref:E3 ubiquitin-protein ligase RNF144B n=1 Tax=Phaedon cochleariae TaxID=80249 RepID=A0A9P0DB50_PHACE|nr:unnamed protein product [Phaedon cochleariae]
MTLPVQPACGDKPTAPVRSRDSSAGRRRPACWSAAWADPPSGRRERRRAVCSWSAGYGTLTERDEVQPAALHRYHEQRGAGFQDRGKVADPPLSTLRPKVESLFAMPGIKSMLGGRRRPADPGADPDHAHSPLVAKRGGATPEIVPPTVTPEIVLPTVRPASSLASLRKCETVVALTGYLRSSSSSGSIEPLRPINRLRASPHASHSRMCSRCSSLLTLASTSRYSLNSTTGGFVPAASTALLSPPRLQAPPQLLGSPPVLCKLCLADAPYGAVMRIEECGCAFCVECMKAYVEFEIGEGSYDISCPDAHCPSQGVLRQEEIKRLAGSDLLEKHNMYRLNREVDLDKTRTWCPRAGCETVCSLCPQQKCAPQSVYCPTCAHSFCSNCKREWHAGGPCEERAGSEGGIPFDSEAIKCCPMCSVPIEKDEGCAQMMCKRCKHVFCWYCLASLDDDFLLRHYDKGPCKNKLGHSRASVIWHRTQVIGIFAGFGILLLVASPLLLLVAPCIVCCKCRMCSAANANKLDNEDAVDES